MGDAVVAVEGGVALVGGLRGLGRAGVGVECVSEYTIELGGGSWMLRGAGRGRMVGDEEGVSGGDCVGGEEGG